MFEDVERPIDHLNFMLICTFFDWSRALGFDWSRAFDFLVIVHGTLYSSSILFIFNKTIITYKKMKFIKN